MSNFKKTFITPEKFEEIKHKDLSGPNGWLLFVACNSGLDLAKGVKREYEIILRGHESRLVNIPLLNAQVKNGSKLITSVYSDTETCPRLPDSVAGSNAFVFQSVQELKSGNTVNENLMQLFQMIRVLKVHGANRVTAVTPYFAYSRADKATFLKREATNAKLALDLLVTSGVNDVLTYHLHTEAIRGFAEPQARIIALNGLDLFIDMFPQFEKNYEIITVSTDAGGAKFTKYYADAMGLDYAIANKIRPKAERTEFLGIIGKLEGKKTAIIVDDETVTARSIKNAVKGLHEEGIQQIYVAISHNKIRSQYIDNLIEAHEKYGLIELHVTNTIPQSEEILSLDFVVEHSTNERFARVINRLHYNQSISELFYNPE